LARRRYPGLDRKRRQRKAGGMTTPDLLQFALANFERAIAMLHRHALDTDAPEHGAVEAADLLDAARDALDGSP
jgi:hypothetical protein